jgi:hypothetical protein
MSCPWQACPPRLTLRSWAPSQGSSTATAGPETLYCSRLLETIRKQADNSIGWARETKTHAATRHAVHGLCGQVLWVQSSTAQGGNTTQEQTLEWDSRVGGAQRPFLTAAAGREEGSMMGWGRDLNSSFRRTTPRTTYLRNKRGRGGARHARHRHGGHCTASFPQTNKNASSHPHTHTQRVGDTPRLQR